MTVKLCIAFDASCLGGARPTGVERSFLHTLGAFRALLAQARMHLFVPCDLHASIAFDERATHDLRIPAGVDIHRIPRRVPTALWREALMPRRLEELQADVLWTPTTALPRRTGAVRRIATVHEVPPLRCEESPLRALRQRRARVALRSRADAVVVPSDATRRALLRESPRLAPRTHTIAQPLDKAILRASSEARAQAAGKGLLYVGAYRKRKNLERVAAAWSGVDPVLRGAHKFRWIGTGPQSFARDAGIEIAPACDTAHLVEALRACRALVLASTSEGFGIPALEALAFGRIPIVVQDSAPAEVCGDLALTCDAQDEASIAQAIEVALRDEDFAKHVAEHGPAHARRFTAERSARAWHALLTHAGEAARAP